MKRFLTAVVALFALIMMVMPSVASAGVVVVRPRPVVVQEAVVPAYTPAPFTTVEYYRPWACANPYYRHHHWWRCH
jgi:hypothetical protein